MIFRFVILFIFISFNLYSADCEKPKMPSASEWNTWLKKIKTEALDKGISQNTISKDHLNVNEPDTDEASFPKNYLASNIHIGAPCAARELGKWYRCKFVKICDNQNGWSKLDDIYCIVQSIDFGHYLKVSTTKLRFLPKRLALTWPPFAHPRSSLRATRSTPSSPRSPLDTPRSASPPRDP